MATPCIYELKQDDKYEDDVRKNYTWRIARFTILELLVVIAVIVILASLLLPLLQKAKDTGRRIQCANNMKQIGLAISMYSNDYSSYFPSTGAYGYEYGLLEYLNISGNIPSFTRTIFTCPSDKILRSFSGRPSSYVGNAGTTWSDGLYTASDSQKLSKITNPSSYLCLIEKWDAYHRLFSNSSSCVVRGSYYSSYTTNISSGYHNGMGNTLFSDFHMEFIKNPRQLYSNVQYWTF